jgi:hypothetical protein
MDKIWVKNRKNRRGRRGWQQIRKKISECLTGKLQIEMKFPDLYTTFRCPDLIRFVSFFSQSHSNKMQIVFFLLLNILLWWSKWWVLVAARLLTIEFMSVLNLGCDHCPFFLSKCGNLNSLRLFLISFLVVNVRKPGYSLIAKVEFVLFYFSMFSTNLSMMLYAFRQSRGYQ